MDVFLAPAELLRRVIADAFPPLHSYFPLTLALVTLAHRPGALLHMLHFIDLCLLDDVFCCFLGWSIIVGYIA